MIVLGIDPGLGTTGFAVVKEEKGQFALIYSKAINTPSSLSSSLRLLKLHRQITSLIDAHRPEVIALETLFFGTNVTNAFSVGQARGVVLLAVAQAKVSAVEYHPNQVKIALTGNGHSEKGQVSRMVTRILGLSKNLTPDDVSDAAAIALTHCFSYKLSRLKLAKS